MEQTLNLKNKAVLPLQYYMKWFDDTFSMWLHKHDYFEMMYTSSGICEVVFTYDKDGKNVETHTLNQGQFVFIKPNIYHKLQMNKGQKAFVYNIEFSINDYFEGITGNIKDYQEIDFNKLFNNTNLSALSANKKGYIIASDIAQVGSTLKDLIMVLESKTGTIENNLLIINKEINLFLEIANCVINKSIGSISYIRKANAYILENYQNRELSIDEISKHVNISKSYLEHQYKMQMKQTILNFINTLRVQKAKKLLTNTTMQISKIAVEVGYKDKNQLNYEFKKILGFTPSEFRKDNIDKVVDYQDTKYYSVHITPKE